ncbi:PKD domain-containing protein [bacterium]|nr:PKD domain-containing protein [bacterium]
MRHFALIISTLISLLGVAQSCSIQSDDIVCKGEIITFTPSYSGSPSSFFWQFGDNTTNNQETTTKTYSKTGNITVNLTVTYSDGTTCTASKDIYVHDVPQPNFSFTETNFCLSQHKICLKDNSTMGSTTNGYGVRTIVWGDGGLDSDVSPSSGSTICYEDYDSAGTFTISIEVQNDKGCEAIWERDITILKDYTPDFEVRKGPPGCNEQEVCFVNKKKNQPADLKSFEWDFAGEGKNTTVWDSICFVFTNTGAQTTRFKVELDNGCVSTASKTFNLSFPKVETNVKQIDSVQCYPLGFRFTNPLVAGAAYKWQLYDSNKNFMKVVGSNLAQNIVPPYPGDFYVRLVLNKSNCASESPLFSIRSLGLDAAYDIRNGIQCQLEDTVYFHNKSRKHPTAIPYYVWNFKDDSVQLKCSSWRYNCNVDTNEHSKHFYLDTGCYYPKLYAIDRFSGCIDSSEGVVNILDPYGAEFYHKIDIPCLGSKPEYSINFDNNLCFAKIRMVYDSCTDDWTEYRASHVYDSTCNNDGWVTVRFAVQTGDSIIYRSHEPDDYYIDNRKVCNDTMNYHNWFKLHKEPNPEFEFSRDTCLPDSVSLRYVGGDEASLEKIGYSFGFGGPLTEIQIEDTVPLLKSVYYEEGDYSIVVELTDTIGCYSQYGHNEKYGYFNTFSSDTIICTGDTVKFDDSVRYWNDIRAFWDVASNVEQVFYDFDDGNGFSYNGNDPFYRFDSAGDYHVRMLTNDNKGCTDTFTRVIHVGGVHAGIRADSRELLCDQVAQFFDSSYSDFEQYGDVVSSFFWDFGDNTAPSYKEDPFHLYNSGKSFTITHAVVSELGCTDTAYLEVKIIGPNPEFDFVYDSVGCGPYTVTVRSKSTNVTDFIWSMGDDNNTTYSYKSDTAITFTYQNPGIYYIYLEGADSFYNSKTNNYYTCTALFPDTVGVAKPILKRVIVLPTPEVGFTWDGPACKDAELSFYNTSNSRYDDFTWVFNTDTFRTNRDTISYAFSDTGYLNVDIFPTYTPVGIYEKPCFDSLQQQVYVSEVIADFTIQRDNLCSIFMVEDSSYNATTYSWDFDHPQSGDENFAETREASHDYGRDTGFFDICLTVSNKYGCLDTACKEVEARYTEYSSLYNVFTPNGDGVNDDYGMDLINPKLYDLRIYNRWGELVYRSLDPNNRWDGSLFNSGEELPAGEYFYIFKFSFECTDEEQESHGMVEMIRN